MTRDDRIVPDSNSDQADGPELALSGSNRIDLVNAVDLPLIRLILVHP
jgi:hypothetical protein